METYRLWYYKIDAPVLWQGELTNYYCQYKYMAIFAAPSPKHERILKIKRYCANCKREQDVGLDDELCPIYHKVRPIAVWYL